MNTERQFKKLVNKAQTYLKESDIKQLEKVYDFALKAHSGQKRKSNEPFIMHPIEVAFILAELEQSLETLIAGLLHDVVEDTDITEYDIQKLFGEKVMLLVSGVTKLTQLKFSSKEEEQAENYRRMFLSMAEDYRVIIIKLADRLHNMRTLNFLSLKKQREIAQETIDIYAPLAHRLGIYSLKWELEDLAFYYLNPEQYHEIKEQIDLNRKDREAYVNQRIKEIRHMMTRHKISVDVSGRPKNLFSIFRKLSNKNLSFHELYDLSGIRIIVDDSSDCYAALGLIHSKYKPVSERFKDYIALPKHNGYQSLHTTVIGPNGRPMEVQIRTLEMNHIAEFGFASHWEYKSKKAVIKFEGHLQWLTKMVEDQKENLTAKDYLDTLKVDLDMEEVFVFTPKGDLKVLPMGSTALDFAYVIHTDVGNHCKCILVNGEIVSLAYKLQNGDRVEVQTDKRVVPNLERLNFVTSRHSRYAIKQWLHQENKKNLIKRGRERITKHFFSVGMIFDDMLDKIGLSIVKNRFQLAKIEDLYINIEQGDLNSQEVARFFVKTLTPTKTDGIDADIVPFSKLGKVTQNKRVKYSIAKCCLPLPGDEIAGVFVVRKGITVHRMECFNLKEVKKNHSDRVLHIPWEELQETHSSFIAQLKIEGYDREGILHDILQVFYKKHINLRAVTTKVSDDNTQMTALITVDIDSNKDIFYIKQELLQITDIISVFRQLPGVGS